MPTKEEIDALLPQTQCGLCGFKGCMPYAEALAEKIAPINLCPPGGIEGLFAIAEIMNEDPTPFFLDMKEKTKPTMVAIIRENECIGCTKCIQACPVDAILGAGKLMHTVIGDECTGCELCIAPCPVDCIDMVICSPPKVIDQTKRSQFRKRYEEKTIRLKREEQERNAKQKVKERRIYIEAALLRVKAKKNTSIVSKKPND